MAGQVGLARGDRAPARMGVKESGDPPTGRTLQVKLLEHPLGTKAKPLGLQRSGETDEVVDGQSLSPAQEKPTLLQLKTAASDDPLRQTRVETHSSGWGSGVGSAGTRASTISWPETGA